MEEIYSFTQTDLIDDDVMLLDTYSSVLLWVGAGSSDTEKKKAIETAQAYVAGATDGRDTEAPILRVNSGSEPPMFTCNFVGWDPELAQANKFEDPYEKKLRLMREAKEQEARDRGEVVEQAAPPPAPEPVPIAAAAAAGPGGTYDLETLRASCPAGVDPAAKQLALSDADFEATFKMSEDDFAALPKWKQTNAKKAAGIF